MKCVDCLLEQNKVAVEVANVERWPLVEVGLFKRP